LTRELLIGADVNYTTWKSFDSLEFKFKNQSDLDFGRGELYKNTFALRIGAQYSLTERIDLRIGGAYDRSPVPDEKVSPENPDADKFVFSAGGSVKLGDNFTVDIAYLLENYKEREVSNSELNFSGTYKSLNTIFGVTLNYKF
jgi:long-chain fatty acid transport protein